MPFVPSGLRKGDRKSLMLGLWARTGRAIAGALARRLLWRGRLRLGSARSFSFRRRHGVQLANMLRCCGALRCIDV